MGVNRMGGARVSTVSTERKVVLSLYRNIVT